MESSSVAPEGIPCGPPNLIEVWAGNREFCFECGDRRKALAEVSCGHGPTPGLLRIRVLWDITHPRWQRVVIGDFKGWLPTNLLEDELLRGHPCKIAAFVFLDPPEPTSVKFVARFYETSDRSEVPYSVDPGLIIKPRP